MVYPIDNHGDKIIKGKFYFYFEYLKVTSPNLDRTKPGIVKVIEVEENALSLLVYGRTFIISHWAHGNSSEDVLALANCLVPAPLEELELRVRLFKGYVEWLDSAINEVRESEKQSQLEVATQ